jgi:hypothetical protein
MRIDTSVDIGYGILVEADEMRPIALKIIEGMSREQLSDWIDLDDYDEEDLKEMDSDDFLDNVEDIASFIDENFPEGYESLVLATYNQTYDLVDGYAITVKGSTKMVYTTGDFFLPQPPLEEEEAELLDFCKKYFPNKIVGWKQWLSFS